MAEEMGKLLDVDDDSLNTRVEFIRSKMIDAAETLRKEIPEDIHNKDLIHNDYFKQWFIANSIYDASLKDIQNEGINRMLYFMFEETKGNLPLILSQYDVKVDIGEDGSLKNIELVILEEEGELNAE